MAGRLVFLNGAKSSFIDLAMHGGEGFSFSGESATPSIIGYYAAIAFMYRCIDVRANNLTKLPWSVQNKAGDDLYSNTPGDEIPTAFPWFADLRRLLWQTEAALCLTSTAYWHKLKSGQRQIGVRWLQPNTMTPIYQGADPYPVTFKRQLPGSTQTTTLPAADVAYLYLPGIDETTPRTAPAQAASTGAGVLYNTDVFVSQYFKRGAIKATLLGVPADTPPQAKQELKAWYDRVLSGIKNAWSAQIINADAITPVVIGSGIDELSNNTLTSEKREDICTAFGVPYSLVMSNASNFATSQQDKLNLYDDTIIPESDIIAEYLNRQLFAPLNLRLVFRPQEMAIYQEDEEQRATAFKTYVDAGIKLSIAAQMLGLNLPEGVTPEMLDEPEPSSPSILLPTPPLQLPGPTAAVGAGDGAYTEEVRKLRRWAKGKAAPDVTKFASAILSDDDKRAALEVGDAPSVPPFLLTRKAMQLLLDDSDENDAERVRRKLEKQGGKDIADGLEDMGKDVARLAKQGTPSVAELNGLRENPVLVQGVQRLLRASAEAGVNFGIDALGNLATDVDWKLVNKDAVAWAREYAGTLINQIDDATLDATRNTLAAWAESGAPLPDLIDQLAPWYGEERATRIAVTETTRSFAEANRQAYAASGVVEKMEWRTAVDELVCPICGPLHEEQRDLDESFGEDVFGEEMFTPPAHPNCRCIVSPVVRSEVVEQAGAPEEEPISAIPPDARTTQEAEDWIRQSLGVDADYSTATLDQANAINRGVAKMQAVYDGPAAQVEKIRFVTGERYVASAGKTIRINRDLFNESTISANSSSAAVDRLRGTTERFNRLEQALNENRALWSDKDIAMAENKIAALRERIDETVTVRYGVPQTMDEILHHEIAHNIQSDLAAGVREDITDFLAPSIQREMGLDPATSLGMRLESIAKTSGHLVSEYATTNSEEYFAESLTAYIKGERDNINGELLGIFGKIIKP